MVRRVVVALKVASAVGGGLGMREYRRIVIGCKRECRKGAVLHVKP